MAEQQQQQQQENSSLATTQQQEQPLLLFTSTENKAAAAAEKSDEPRDESGDEQQHDQDQQQEQDQQQQDQQQQELQEHSNDDDSNGDENDKKPRIQVLTGIWQPEEIYFPTQHGPVNIMDYLGKCSMEHKNALILLEQRSAWSDPTDKACRQALIATVQEICAAAGFKIMCKGWELNSLRFICGRGQKPKKWVGAYESCRFGFTILWRKNEQCWSIRAGFGCKHHNGHAQTEDVKLRREKPAPGSQEEAAMIAVRKAAAAERARKRRLKAHPDMTSEELDAMQAECEERVRKRLREAHPDQTDQELDAMMYPVRVQGKAAPGGAPESTIPDDPVSLALYNEMKRMAHANPEAAAIMTNCLTEGVATMKRLLAAQKKRRPKK